MNAVEVILICIGTIGGIVLLGSTIMWFLEVLASQFKD